MKISIHPEIRAACPDLRLGCLRAKVKTMETGPALEREIARTVAEKAQIPLEAIKEIPPIAASRIAYKALGKAPSRYRLSAEALHRRLVKGQGLYRISNVVEIINLVSLRSGFSIGGYDAARIRGAVQLGPGLATDRYEAIGRGLLNIENLPVFRDDSGAFGSPTSDSTRTRITHDTRDLLLIFLDFGGDPAVEDAIQHAAQLLETHAAASQIETFYVHTNPSP